MKNIHVDDTTSMALYWLTLQLQRAPEGSERRISLLNQIAMLRNAPMQRGDFTLPRIEFLSPRQEVLAPILSEEDYRELSRLREEIFRIHRQSEENISRLEISLAAREQSLQEMVALRIRTENAAAQRIAAVSGIEAAAEKINAAVSGIEAAAEKINAAVSEIEAATEKRNAAISRTEARLDQLADSIAQTSAAIGEAIKMCKKAEEISIQRDKASQGNTLLGALSFDKLGKAWGKNQRLLVKSLAVVAALFSFGASFISSKEKDRQRVLQWLLLLFVFTGPAKNWVRNIAQSVQSSLLRRQKTPEIT